MSKEELPRFEWRLQLLMRDREIFHNAELQRRLAYDGINLSSSQVHRLATEVPERLNLKVLSALCNILECTPADLIVVSERSQIMDGELKQKAVGNDSPATFDGRRPRRAKIT